MTETIIGSGWTVGRPNWPGAPAEWRWSCNNPDGIHHHSVDDQGFFESKDEAAAAGSLHVKDFHNDNHPLCGLPLAGRIRLICNQWVGHQSSCAYVTAEHVALLPIREVANV